jgi:hypothetical protein
MTEPFADPTDVEAIWRPLSQAETAQVEALLIRASAKLRQKCPFNIDARIALYFADSTEATALDPLIVADVTANIVKRFMVNIEGFASTSETMGPFARSGTFVNRYDKTGSDVRGAIQVIDSDIDQLRPAVAASMPATIKLPLPRPSAHHRFGQTPLPGCAVDGIE